MGIFLKRWLVGLPLATAQAVHERLTKRVALAVFSSDALSSTAYATEEILLVLAVAASFAHSDAPFAWVVPVSLAIVVLLWLVGFSYRQTIYAYPSGGGAYIVAKENLGTHAGLTAAAALLVDYVLTVAVSISAGVAAVTSAVQGTPLAWVAEYRTALCVGAIALITLANLRGVRESGAIFSVPTYVFVFSFLGMIAYGLAYYWLHPGVTVAPAGEDLKHAEGYPLQALSLFLILGAFSNGCAALTGVEAISNGIPAFKKPESRNAAITLLWMVTLLTVMFLGTSVLAYLYRVQPRESETVISQFARTMFHGPMTWAYFLVQGSTAAILLLAANTSFADFPRLSSLMARDGFLPRQFANLGDRLVFSNGIVVLALFSALLVWAFGGDTSRLIPLYAVGVFLSFTLSQGGMVRHWWKEREAATTPGPAEQARAATVTTSPNGVAGCPEPAGTSPAEGRRPAGWKRSLVINAVGALATALVLVVFIVTKFVHGAWIVVVVVPLLVLLFALIRRHYRDVDEQLILTEVKPLGCRHNTVIVPIRRVHQGVRAALEYARCLSNDVHAAYVEVDPAQTDRLRREWEKLETDIKLKVIPSPYRAFVGALVDYVNEVDARRGDDIVTVLLPEYVPQHWWQQVLHNQPLFLLKAALLYRPGIVVTSMPYHLR